MTFSEMMLDASTAMRDAIGEIDRLRARVAELEAQNASLSAAYGQMAAIALNISGAPAGKPQPQQEQKGTAA